MATVRCGIEVLFCLSFAVFFATVKSFLDIEELKNVHYEIDISDKPVLVGRPIQQEVLYLASKFGQRYECQLPDMTDYEKEQEEEKVASEVGISELLKPMETAPCILKTKDWWTYEFCYNRHIKQYHLSGTLQENVKYLGHYESEMDWSNNTHKDAKRHKLNRYHSHSYTNGTECDITGKPREVEVRFICSEGQGDSIDRIDEPSSCVYILTVHTTRICHHPFLRPPPNLKPKPVLCFPALEQDQFERYTQVQEEKDKQKQEAIAKLKEQMQKVRKAPPSKKDDEEDTKADGEKTGKGAKDTGVEGIQWDGVIDGDSNPEELQKMLNAVVKSVKNVLQTVDDEVQETSETTSKVKKTQSKSGVEEGGDDKDDDQDSEEDDFGEDEDIDSMTAEELEEYMNKDYTELMKEFRDGIGEMTDDPAEAARLTALAEQLETSFENLDAMDDVIDDVSGQLTSSGVVDDEGTKHLVEMLSKLIREVLNGPHLKEYMKTNKLYLSTLVKDFRESIEHMTQDPAEMKRLSGLADDLESTVKELEAEEEEAEDDGDGVVEEEDDVEGRKEEVEIAGDLHEEENFVDTLKKLIKDAKTQSGKSIPKKPKLPTSPTDDGKVRVRVTRIKLDKDKNKKVSLEDGEEVQVFDSNHRKIEESVQQHLDNAGVNLGAGGRVEFRILTYSPDEWPEGEDSNDFTILSEDDSLYFKNLIVGLLGSDAEVKEQSRQTRLESNYQFTWDQEGAQQGTEPTDLWQIPIADPVLQQIDKLRQGTDSSNQVEESSNQVEETSNQVDETPNQVERTVDDGSENL